MGTPLGPFGIYAQNRWCDCVDDATGGVNAVIYDYTLRADADTRETSQVSRRVVIPLPTARIKVSRLNVWANSVDGAYKKTT